MSGKKITYLGNPTADTDATTKKYVDDQESKYLSVRGGIMLAFLYMNNNGISNLRAPEQDFDAATKKYVDDKEIPITTSLTIINDGIDAFRTEFTNHVQTFLNFRRNINRTNNEFFGTPPTVIINLADINTRLNDIMSGIPNIIKNTDLIKIPHKQIKNIVYTVSSGKATWSQQNNTLKHTAEVTGVYRLSLFSSAKFSIFTTFPWRYSTDDFSGTVSIVLNKDIEETFKLIADNKKLTTATYWWCIEFVAETPEQVI